MESLRLLNILRTALDASRATVTINTDLRSLHRERSTYWVGALGDAFAAVYASRSDVRVLCGPRAQDRKEFGINEMLYDLSVVEVGTVESAVHRVSLTYIKHAIWQVESEFEPNSRDALDDFNKLVVGNADHKLFVGSQIGPMGRFIDVLRKPAAHCTGSVHVALLPHPAKWTQPSEERVLLWRFKDDSWERIAATAPL